MTPDEHLARAEALLTVADDLFTRGQKTDDWPDQIRLTEASHNAAALATCRVLLAKELRERLADEWRLVFTGADLGAVAPVTPIRRPQVGDVKDCECCGTTITAVPSNGTLLWAETETSVLHDCPPPEAVPLEQYRPPAHIGRAPAGDAGTPDQQPHGDQS